MPFSAQTCLSYIGTTELTNPLLLYSDTNEYSESFGSLSLSDITGTNCPKIITDIPDGTKKIKIVSNNLYCVYIDISCDEICNVCDLGFTGFTTNNIGKISIGTLSGSCQSNITNYLINWYGPDNTTNIAFTSGLGTAFNYGYSHPIVDLIATGGVYAPKLQKVIINGETFSSTGGTNQILAKLDCLPSVSVRDFNCGNGTSTGDFSHIMNFKSASNGAKPGDLNAHFLLTGVTKYFGIKFIGEKAPDTLKITFSGINYPTPIVLENMMVGQNLGTNNVAPTNIPRQISMDQYSKLLCLTGLTISPDDYLIITVIPNTGITDTNWSLSLKCLSNIDTSINGYEVYKNQPLKISANTISITENSCNGVTIGAKTIGVPSSPAIIQTLPYLGSYYPYSSYQANSVNSSYYNDIFPSKSSCYLQYNGIVGSDSSCVSSGGTIIFNKTYNSTTSAGTYSFEFSNQIDFNDYYNSALSVLIHSGSSDPTTIDYYRFVSFLHRTSKNLSSTTTSCGTDNEDYIYFYLHPGTMKITTGITTFGNYTLSIVQPKLPPASTNLGFSTCDLNCQSNVNQVITSYINPSVDIVYSYTTTVGLRTKTPFLYFYTLSGPNTTSILDTASLFSSYIQYYAYANKMYPYSGTNTLIPSLSAITSQAIYNLPNGNTDAITVQQDLGYYEVRLINPLNRRDFEIWGRRVINYGYAAGYELAYRYSGGTVTYSDPYYII